MSNKILIVFVLLALVNQVAKADAAKFNADIEFHHFLWLIRWVKFFPTVDNTRSISQSKVYMFRQYYSYLPSEKNYFTVSFHYKLIKDEQPEGELKESDPIQLKNCKESTDEKKPTTIVCDDFEIKECEKGMNITMEYESLDLVDKDFQMHVKLTCKAKKEEPEKKVSQEERIL